MRVLLLVALWALLLAAGVIIGIILPRRRSKILHQKASALGFAFSASGRPFSGTRVETLTVLEDGSATEVENVLERVEDEIRTVIFDEQIATDVAAHATTFAAFRAPNVELPVFHIGERNIFERVEEACGKKVLKLDCNPKFTQHFFVQCEDEARTRGFLSAAKLCTLCDHARHFYIEASEDWLLVYKPGVTVSIDGVGKFVDETRVIAQALLSPSPMPLPASA
jgi:hypothetical protein